MIQRGTIAECQRGYIGLITCEKPQVVDEGTAEQWRGIHLSPGLVGQPWVSKKPKFIAHISELLARFARAIETDTPAAYNPMQDFVNGLLPCAALAHPQRAVAVTPDGYVMADGTNYDVSGAVYELGGEG